MTDIKQKKETKNTASHISDKAYIYRCDMKTEKTLNVQQEAFITYVLYIYIK